MPPDQRICSRCFKVSSYSTVNTVPGVVSSQEVEVEQVLTSHQTHYRSYRGRAFTGQMTQPTVSKN